MTDCSHIAFCILLSALAESYFTAVNKGGWEDFVAENFNYGMCDS